MGRTRDVARALVREGRCDVLQRGRVLDAEEPYRGPIRLRKADRSHRT